MHAAADGNCCATAVLTVPGCAKYRARRGWHQASAWLASSAISIALSVAILQPAKALMGSFLASIATAAAAVSAVTALAITGEMAAMM